MDGLYCKNSFNVTFYAIKVEYQEFYLEKCVQFKIYNLQQISKLHLSFIHTVK